jgi:hypothetical protein
MAESQPLLFAAFVHLDNVREALEGDILAKRRIS